MTSRSVRAVPALDVVVSTRTPAARLTTWPPEASGTRTLSPAAVTPSEPTAIVRPSTVTSVAPGAFETTRTADTPTGIVVVIAQLTPERELVVETEVVTAPRAVGDEVVIEPIPTVLTETSTVTPPACVSPAPAVHRASAAAPPAPQGCEKDMLPFIDGDHASGAIVAPSEVRTEA